MKTRNYKHKFLKKWRNRFTTKLIKEMLPHYHEIREEQCRYFTKSIKNSSHFLFVYFQRLQSKGQKRRFICFASCNSRDQPYFAFRHLFVIQITFILIECGFQCAIIRHNSQLYSFENIVKSESQIVSCSFGVALRHYRMKKPRRPLSNEIIISML